MTFYSIEVLTAGAVREGGTTAEACLITTTKRLGVPSVPYFSQCCSLPYVPECASPGRWWWCGGGVVWCGVVGLSSNLQMHSSVLCLCVCVCVCVCTVLCTSIGGRGNLESSVEISPETDIAALPPTKGLNPSRRRQE
jgi:hypothetical protein